MKKKKKRKEKVNFLNEVLLLHSLLNSEGYINYFTRKHFCFLKLCFNSLNSFMCLYTYIHRDINKLPDQRAACLLYWAGWQIPAPHPLWLL